MKKKETFEVSFGRLQEILTKMENPDTSLDDSLALYAEGAKLVKSCMQQLEEARVKFTAITGELESGEEA